MDIFDEFEFKPLTEGLGFHKKEVLLREDELRKKEALKTESKTDLFQTTQAKNNIEFNNSFEPRLELDFSSAQNKMAEVDQLLQKFPSIEKPVKSTAQNKNTILMHEPLPRNDVALKTENTTPKNNLDIKLQTANATQANQSISTNESLSPIKPKLNIDDLKRELDVKRKASESQISKQNESIETKNTVATNVNTTVEAKTANLKASIANAPLQTGIPSISANIATKAAKNIKATQTSLNTETTTVKLKASRVNFLAAALDSIVVFGFINIFIAILLLVTEIDVYSILTQTSSDLITQFSLVLLAFAALELYMVVSRSFFGMSLGEWAMDVQLGTAEQQNQASYPLKVAWRSFVNLATGLVVLPILSYIFNRDIAYFICGLELHERD